ncbi:MAG: GPW/gp25 family protein [Aquamicrobium sp.]|uniref:GPW/gp25 family protein n=1 Tax=Aquamicrobium sp. TaxID=1872579 RepID=UPI00349ED5A8|nr:GPW/gp25 family protein [Aquamicrobium sp.]
MAGIDARTGELLEGFSHVEQSLEKILSTPQGSRVMREWLGNPGLRLLGENITEGQILLWFNITWMLVELFEPRFRITRFDVNHLDRLGLADFTMAGEYRPYAHLDWEQARAFVSVDGTSVTVARAT